MLEEVSKSWDEIIQEYSAIQKKLEKLTEEIKGPESTSSDISH